MIAVPTMTKGPLTSIHLSCRAPAFGVPPPRARRFPSLQTEQELPNGHSVWCSSPSSPLLDKTWRVPGQPRRFTKDFKPLTRYLAGPYVALHVGQHVSKMLSIYGCTVVWHVIKSHRDLNSGKIARCAFECGFDSRKGFEWPWGSMCEADFGQGLGPPSKCPITNHQPPMTDGQSPTTNDR